eukprot:IDg7600t1
MQLRSSILEQAQFGQCDSAVEARQRRLDVGRSDNLVVQKRARNTEEATGNDPSRDSEIARHECALHLATICVFVDSFHRRLQKSTVCLFHLISASIEIGRDLGAMEPVFDSTRLISTKAHCGFPNLLNN